MFPSFLLGDSASLPSMDPGRSTGTWLPTGASVPAHTLSAIQGEGLEMSPAPTPPFSYSFVCLPMDVLTFIGHLPEWIKKIRYIYIMEHYSAMKKNKIMPFAATWMDLAIIILSKVSQKEKNKHHMISLLCGI